MYYRPQPPIRRRPKPAPELTFNVIMYSKMNSLEMRGFLLEYDYKCLEITTIRRRILAGLTAGERRG